MSPLALWTGFGVIVAALLCLDLFVLNRTSHVIGVREAVFFSLFWMGLALLFNAGVLFVEGKHKAMEFLAGYLIEQSLSVDNIFVFIIIFRYFRVNPAYHHKILFWGILGAIAMRLVFILTGVALIRRFEWVTYLFGAFLVYTGFKMAVEEEEGVHPERNPVLKAARRFLPVTQETRGDRLLLREAGRWIATPLFIVLLVIETSDLIFAVDSIPAVLAISSDPSIVYTSNIFAILGLRALYFALAGFMDKFHLLRYGLSLILAFVGVKMLISHFYRMPIGLALGVVAAVLGGSVVASMAFPPKETPAD